MFFDDGFVSRTWQMECCLQDQRKGRYNNWESRVWVCDHEQMWATTLNTNTFLGVFPCGPVDHDRFPRSADQFQYWWISGGPYPPLTWLDQFSLHPWLHSQNWFTRKMCRKPPWLGDVEIKKRWFPVNLGCLKLHIWLCETPTAPTSSDCCLVSSCTVSHEIVP